MANYIKIEGTGGGTSGSGLINIKIYDQNNNLVLLTKNNVIEHNATIRTDEENFRVMFQEGNISPYCPYNSNKDSIYYVIEIPTDVSIISKIELLNYSTSSYKVDTVNIYHSLDNENFNLIDTVSGLVSANTATPILNIKMINFKILLKSNNKIYSLKSEEILHETKMTSNTSPAPYVASASSVYNTSYPAWRVFDGANNTNSWTTATGATNAWLQLDFGNTNKKLINKVVINCTQNSVDCYPKKFSILGSDDGISFEQLSLFSNVSWEKIGLTKEFSFFNEKEFRYYRVHILENNGGVFSTITELKFGYEDRATLELRSNKRDNFIHYGISSISKSNSIYGSKNYILQDTVSENADGLWVQEIDRKPLSIKFE